MVFGWGKKREEKSVLPLTNQISFFDVPKIIQQTLELRTTQTLSAIKSLRDVTEPLIQELILIGNSLEKDDLQVSEIDKHLQIIVIRGKQQVIDVIKKDVVTLPEIITYEDTEHLNSILNLMLKKIGDVLGRQTRVIHIFAKKYAEKLKEILIQMNSNHSEIQQLLKNFDYTKLLYSEISELLNEIDSLEIELKKKTQRIAEINNDLYSLSEKIILLDDSIKNIKTSNDYAKYLDLTQLLDKFTTTQHQIRNIIDSQFTKISRPLGRYEYISSLDKSQKILLSKLIKNPFEVLLLENKDSIVLILENVRKGIISGSISVKDPEKSLSQITETEESLDGFIRQVSGFLVQRDHIQNQIAKLEMGKLSALIKNLETTKSDKDSFELKIKTLQSEINDDSIRISNLISEIESKLKKFTNVLYTITY